MDPRPDAPSSHGTFSVPGPAILDLGQAHLTGPNRKNSKQLANLMRLLPALLASTLIGSAVELPAQLYVSEVSFQTSPWIEIYNAGSQETDLSNHSLYYATKTPNRSGNYWFGFPAGTKVAGGNWIRVFWGAAIATPTDKRNVYTGSRNWHFLFGHGWEALNPSEGAVGIIKSKLNKDMNSADIFEDYVQWGRGGFNREAIAVASKIWAKDTFVAKQEVGSSMSLLYERKAKPTPPSAYFSDFSPSPLQHNSAPASVTTITTTGCGVNQPNPILLEGISIPVFGSKDFGLRVRNTQGPAFFERMTLFVSFTGATSAWGPCTVLALQSGTFIFPFMGTSNGSTDIKLPLLHPATAGRIMDVQALVFANNYFSFSNRVKLVTSFY